MQRDPDSMFKPRNIERNKGHALLLPRGLSNETL